MSERALRTHYEGHYLKYVRNVNEIQATGRMRSALGFNFRGARLHELLWESMTPDPGPEPAWEVEVPGRGVMGPVDALVTTVRRVRGSGWAFLSWNPFTREIVAHVVPNHSYPAERFLRPLICVDAWEHAYYIDSPADREDYLDRIVNVLNWGTALKRFEA